MLKWRRSDEREDEVGLSRLFMIALRTGSTTAVRAFLGRKAALAGTDSKGRSPLLIASAHGHLSICELLLEAGSDPFATDRSGLDGREHARLGGHGDIVSLIARAQQASAKTVDECAAATSAELADFEPHTDPAQISAEPESGRMAGPEQVTTQETVAAIAHHSLGEANANLEWAPADREFFKPIEDVRVSAVQPDTYANHEVAKLEDSWSRSEPAAGDSTLAAIEVSAHNVATIPLQVAEPVYEGHTNALAAEVALASELAPYNRDVRVHEEPTFEIATDLWEVDTTSLNSEDDRAAIQAAMDAQERLSTAPARSLDGADWSSVEIDLPEPLASRTQRSLPKSVLAAAAGAIQVALEAGEYADELFRISHLFTEKQERTLRKVLRASVGAAGGIVDRESDPWLGSIEPTSIRASAPEAAVDALELFATSCDAIGRPNSYDVRLDSLPRLSKNEEADLFGRVGQAMAEAMLEIAKSHEAIDFILAADDRVEEGVLSASFISCQQVEADDELHVESEEQDDDVGSDDRLQGTSAFIELPSAYVGAVIELRSIRQGCGKALLPSEVRRAARALHEIALTPDFMRYLAIELPRLEGHTRTMDGAFAALARADKARRMLLERHLPHVRAFAQRYADRGLDLDDVIQEGNVGLMRAIQTFDTTRGLRFWTYAQAWVWQRISRSIADYGDAIRLPVHVHQARRRMEATLNGLVGTDCGAIDVARLANASSLPVKTVKRFLAIRSVDSLEDCADLAMDGIAGALIADLADDDPLENALLADLARVVLGSLNGLPDRIADVIRLRFGLDDRGDHTLEEIGQKYGVTRERIRQLEAKGLAILAHSSRTRVLRTLLNS
jgi:RNA polymerase primary sigma factor